MSFVVANLLLRANVGSFPLPSVPCAGKHDIVIIGAGPQALAVLAALHEHSYASPQFSDTAFNARIGYGGHKQVGSVHVIDPAGKFMASWNQRFEMLGIQHLRSPMFAHPDAYEATALLNFAVTEGRTAEIYKAPDCQVKGVIAVGDVGNTKETLLQGLPGTALFCDFCAALEARHRHQFHRGSATEVHKDPLTEKYEVFYKDGVDNEQRILADAVVLATGPQGSWNIPAPFQAYQHNPALVHTEELFGMGGNLSEAVSRHVPVGITMPRVLVIGGGITAAQAALAAVRAGCRVVLRSRRALRTRSYDLSREWFDRRHANRLRFEFLETSLEERPKFLKAALGGGSTPAAYLAELQSFSSDVLQMQVCTDIDESKVSLDENGEEKTIRVNDETFHLVILATGVSTAPMQVPIIKGLQERFPTSLVNGVFPELDSSLRWSPDEDIFLVGGNAALQLGPGAVNLMGAMRGAKLVAEALHGLMWERATVASGRRKKLETNLFSLLAGSDEEDSEEDSEEESESDGSESDISDSDNNSLRDDSEHDWEKGGTEGGGIGSLSLYTGEVNELRPVQTDSSPGKEDTRSNCHICADKPGVLEEPGKLDTMSSRLGLEIEEDSGISCISCGGDHVEHDTSLQDLEGLVPDLEVH